MKKRMKCCGTYCACLPFFKLRMNWTHTHNCTRRRQHHSTFKLIGNMCTAAVYCEYCVVCSMWRFIRTKRMPPMNIKNIWIRVFFFFSFFFVRFCLFTRVVRNVSDFRRLSILTFPTMNKERFVILALLLLLPLLSYALDEWWLNVRIVWWVCVCVCQFHIARVERITHSQHTISIFRMHHCWKCNWTLLRKRHRICRLRSHVSIWWVWVLCVNCEWVWMCDCMRYVLTVITVLCVAVYLAVRHNL